MSTGMTPIGIQRIERRLDAIVPFLDMTDYANRQSQEPAAKMSRALAAYCVKLLGATDNKTAAGSITDRFHDRGIDAIYYDQKSSRLLLVQAKWSSGIQWKDAGEFVDGTGKLVNGKWEAFSKNEKIYGRRNEIDIALRSAAKIVLVTVHHGPNPADSGVLKRVSDLARALDGGSGLAEAIHWHQFHLLDGLQRESDPPAVDADLYLSNWGEIREPYHSVFGRVQGRALAELWKKHPQVTHMNLRDYAQRSDVNLAIAQTARHEPHHFWYFNNGLTIICESIKPGIFGRLQQDVALFHFEGISLVNGAQTTGIVGDNFDSIQESDKDRLWIQMRAIAVKNCPEGFAKRVTKFTNLQNAISVQDFLSLDPLHARIATDFAVDKRRYAFRWGGDTDPTGEQGCTLKEVTFALACANPDPWYAVQAKREISALWDTDSDRYKALFHPDLTVTRIWNAIKIKRAVENVVDSCQSVDKQKADMVASHLQWIVLHIVFQDPSIVGWDTASDSSAILPTAQTVAHGVFESVREDILINHPSEYLASLSKNFEKCERLVYRIRNPQPKPGPQAGSIEKMLFE
jgi:hypothetical protein